MNSKPFFPLKRVRFLRAFAHTISISISVHSLILSVFHFKATLFDKIIILLTFSSQPTKGKERIYMQLRKPRFNPWVGKIRWRREWQPTPVFLPGKFHGPRSLAGYSPWGHKESDRTEQLTHRQQHHNSCLNKVYWTQVPSP